MYDWPNSEYIKFKQNEFINLMSALPVNENTHYHIKEAYKLKNYFDNLIGYNLYDLFPEIKENL